MLCRTDFLHLTMQVLSCTKLLCPSVFALLFLVAADLPAAGNGPLEPAAEELAARLTSNLEGNSIVRLKMEIRNSADGPTKGEFQLLIKQRRTAEASDLVYQVLYPRERKGEAVLLHQSAGHAPNGYVVVPPNKPKAVEASQISDPLLGSSLSYADAIENVFAWKNQAVVGHETIDRVDCIILESKPGESDHSNYARARSWIDTRRTVPLRVEKYFASGRLARRIDTIRVAFDEGHAIPANLTVRNETDGAVTELDGSRITHDVTFSSHDFTVQGMTESAGPAGQ